MLCGMTPGVGHKRVNALGWRSVKAKSWWRLRLCIITRKYCKYKKESMGAPVFRLGCMCYTTSRVLLSCNKKFEHCLCEWVITL